MLILLTIDEGETYDSSSTWLLWSCLDADGLSSCCRKLRLGCSASNVTLQAIDLYAF